METTHPPSATGRERSGWTGALLRLGETLADFVFPRLCCGCGERVIEPGRLICVPCERLMAELALPLCPTCGLPDARAGASRCSDCPRGEIFFTAARACTPFAGLASVVVHKLKYSRRLEYADFMAGRMEAVAREEFAGIGFDALVPVPLYPTRQRERGFNQAAELARRIAPALRAPVEPTFLLRTRPTSSQTRLKKNDRAENVRGAFSCPRPAAVAGKRLLLVDDVYTTGATLNECARMLKEAGRAESVHCLAFARALVA